MRKIKFSKVTSTLLALAMFIYFPASVATAQKQVAVVYSPGYGLTGSLALDNLEPALRTQMSSSGTKALRNFYTTSIRVKKTSQQFGCYSDLSCSYSQTQQGRIEGQDFFVTNDVRKASNSNPDTIILVGQSQGGIRVRSALQLDMAQSGNEYLREKVGGIATISSPNEGGPLLTDGVAVVKQASKSVFRTSKLVFGPISYALEDLLHNYLELETNTYPGVTDMHVGSSLLTTMNNAVTYEQIRDPDCASSTNKKYGLATVVNAIPVYGTVGCDVVKNGEKRSNAYAIPERTAVMSIVSNNGNNIDGLIKNLGLSFNTRDTIADVAATLAWGTGAMGFVFPFLWFGTAIFAKIASFLYSLPETWRTAVAGKKGLQLDKINRGTEGYRSYKNYGDAFFAENDQVIPESAGGRDHQKRVVEGAAHDLSRNAGGVGALTGYAPTTALYLDELAFEALRLGQ